MFNPKLANIFGRMPRAANNFKLPSIVAPPALRPESVPSQEMPVFRRNPMESALTTPAMDEFRTFSAQYPQRGNVTKWDRLAAALEGVGTSLNAGPGAGVKAVRERLELPHQRALEDWGNKGAALESAARIESMNLGRHNSAEKNDITDRYNQGRIKVAEMNAETARLKLSQGNFRYAGMTENGNPIVIDQTTGKYNVFDDVDMYSDKEELGAKLNSAMERARLAAKTSTDNNIRTNATSRANNKDTNATSIENNNARIEGAANRQQAGFDFRLDNPGTSTEPRFNASAERYMDQEALMEIARENPNYIGKVLFQKPNGDLFFVAPQEPGIFGTDLTPMFEEATNKYNERKSKRRKPTSPTKPKPTTSGSVQMKDKKGEIYNIPVSEVKEAEADGLVRIK